jgi:hypothetical protein
MPISPTYPGIYIQEAASSSHTIVSAPTNIAVFIGYAHPFKTPAANLGVPVEIFGFSDYVTNFGGFVSSVAFAKASYADAASAKTYTGVFGDLAVAVNQFFLNGGTDAYVVALNNSVLSSLPPGTVQALGGYTLSAREVTDALYTMTLEIRPCSDTLASSDPLADLKITYGPLPPSSGAPSSPPSSPPASPPVPFGAGVVVETFRRVSLVTGGLNGSGLPNNSNHILNRLGTSSAPISSLVSVSAGGGASGWPTAKSTVLTFSQSLIGANAEFFSAADFTAVMAEDTPLDKLPLFNLMVIPGVADNSGVNADGSGALILSQAMAFCENKRAFLVVDPPVLSSADATTPGATPIATAVSSIARSKNAALYFPYLASSDPITGSTTNLVTSSPYEIPPAATVAGVYAATDLARGVWKAPAGFQATTNNVSGVVARGRMTDDRQGTLNPIGVNCLRDFPNVPTIVFGARTLATTFDQQWTYVPVRRTALFLEQTFYATLKWVIFEPNAEPLWTAITMSMNAFMLGLFKQGAFQGTTPSDAFRVQCDSSTTSQADIDSGIVNIVVSFAPLKPAEFVVITIAQLAGQAQTS